MIKSVFTPHDKQQAMTPDVAARKLNILFPAAEINSRKLKKKNSYSPEERGYVHLYQQHVEQGHLGADFDFLKGKSGREVKRDSH